MTCFAVCAGDAAEALRRHVLALDVLVRDVGPVDVEVVVGDERVLALSRLLLELLELLELALAGLVVAGAPRCRMAGSSTEKTRKSPVSSSISTRSRGATAPGVFL